jgi:hypothetical protein
MDDSKPAIMIQDVVTNRKKLLKLDELYSVGLKKMVSTKNIIQY